MKITIRIKLAIYSIGLVLFTSLALFVGAFRINRDALIGDIGQRLEEIAATAVLQLDGDLHEQITSPDQVNDEPFTTLRGRMQLMHKAAKLDQDLYTVRKKGDSLEYVVMSHTKPFIGNTYDNSSNGTKEIVDSVFRNGKSAHTGLFISTQDSYIAGYAAIKNSAGKVVGILCVDFTATSLDSIMLARLRDMFWLGLLVMGLTIPISMLAVHKISSRIRRAVSLVEATVTQKDFTQRMVEGGSDEMAQLAISFNLLTQDVQTLIGKVASSAEDLTLSSAELAGRSVEMNTTAGEMSRKTEGVASSVRNASSQVTDIATEAESSASSVAELAEANSSIGHNLCEVNQAFKDLAEDMISLGGAMSHVSSSINEVARNIDETSRISHEATEKTMATNHKVEKLRESANEVGQVVKVITLIAEKTNLLALNASIEAARAGDAGRGFAVVATEVKDLAHQTAKSTDDIQQKILDIQASTREALDAIGEITTVISTIDDRTSSINSAIDQQTKTVSEMESRMHMATERATQVSKRVSKASEFSTEITDKATHTMNVARNISNKATSVAHAASVAQTDTESVSGHANQSVTVANNLSTQAEKLSQMAVELNGLIAPFRF